MLADRYYATLADVLEPRITERQEIHPVGGAYCDPGKVALRAFRRYSSAATIEVIDPMGRFRWLGKKQGRVYAIVHRLSVSGERMTMTAIAAEALCATSTVSRSILKFQSWGMFAIDVVRGRNGGISVRLRTLRDGLQSYAEAAWQRIVSAANRARINVASLITGTEATATDTEVLTVTTLSTYRDATFSEAWANAEARGAEIRAEAAAAERELGPVNRDRDWYPGKGRLSAENVVAERRWLDANEPDWWLIAEQARERLIVD